VSTADVLPEEAVSEGVTAGAAEESCSWSETEPTRVEEPAAAVAASDSDENTEPVWPQRPSFQLVSHDADLLARLNQALGSDSDRITTVALRDAGVSLLGEPPPIVVVDMRNQAHRLEAVAALCRTRPRASVIAIFEGRASVRELYGAGVVSICSAGADTVAACMRSVARQRRYLSNELAVAEGVRASFARLHRIIADLRSGLLSTSVSLNLLQVLAESIDRGVLLVPEGNQLIAMGAFGQTALGEALAERTRNLAIPMAGDGVLAACLADSRTRRASYESARLPAPLAAVVDRPLTGEIVVLPLPGSERVIAVIYLDNGARDRPLADIEVFELAAFQLGLALENEALRRVRDNKPAGL
jgi:DNA-binding NarL/FixJ family response regulator